MKRSNSYAGLVGALYDSCPKAVFAAIAVSYASAGGDHPELVEYNLLREWWALFHSGIVPQRPPVPEPIERDAPEAGAEERG